MGTLLKLDNVSKKFGALTVTDGINLEVAQGEALGIIGPNGAGKSTLFNLITGNLRPDAGRIHLADRDVTKMPAARRIGLGVGRSFQIPQPFEGLTVLENTLTAAVFGQRRAERSVEDKCIAVLQDTELLDKANMLAGSLSLLDRKRLELARAMATEPRLLLLDEIAGGLTEAECQALIETIKTLHREGTTLIWIEHVLHALTSVVERIAVIDFGQLIAVGEAQEVMASKQVQEIYLGLEA